MGTSAVGAGVGAAFIFVIFFFSFVVMALITRWLFVINRRVNAAEAALIAQLRMSIRSGMTHEEANFIIDRTYGKGSGQNIRAALA